PHGRRRGRTSALVSVYKPVDGLRGGEHGQSSRPLGRPKDCVISAVCPYESGARIVKGRRAAPCHGGKEVQTWTTIVSSKPSKSSPPTPRCFPPASFGRSPLRAWRISCSRTRGIGRH